MSGAATRHWRNERLTALALVPLSLWFLASLLRQPALDHATVVAWLGQPLQALLALLLGLTLLWHSLQGVTVVLEDYVRAPVFAPTLWIVRLAHLAAAVVLAWAVASIALGSA